ncbi:hypothetical protein DUPY_04070 [Duganella phyllosphaerae]|uniref:Uncharacterized protein n=1 Tax=Duganella phyllosphaerae TaxID=762836 RepID=A0A1E7X7G2_9BURK|nr:hypothetical protein DUPY_04070 [Duganella phyllosphaerae]
MAPASATLPPVAPAVVPTCAATVGTAFNASSVAIASMPFMPMRSRDTSLPHNFQVDVAAFILSIHHWRWVLPRMETLVSGGWPAAVVAAIFCASTAARVCCGTR